jgi:FixJ family two-component response regulator
MIGDAAGRPERRGSADREATTMDDRDHVVFVVDDDPRVRDAVENLLLACGIRVLAFDSAAAFLAAPRPAITSCLVLDVDLPDINGLELQQRLSGGRHPPIIFVTGYGDVPSSVRAMKAGAVDFLPKPFAPEQLLAAIESALALDRQRRTTAAEIDVLQARYETLTPRERDVLPLVVRGMLNKQAAAHLGISLVTLQIHRGNVMRKMAAKSVSELVRMSIKLGMPAPGTNAGAVAVSPPAHGRVRATHDERLG